MNKFNFFLSFFCVFNTSFADFLGSSIPLPRLPGYINFSHKAEVNRDTTWQWRYPDDMEKRSPSEILEHYFQNGHFDQNSFSQLLEVVAGREKDEYLGFCLRNGDEYGISLEQCKKGESHEKINKKWQEENFVIAIREIKKNIQETIELSSEINSSNLNSPEALPFLNKFFISFELLEALKKPYRDQGMHSEIGKILLNTLPALIGPNKYLSIKRGTPEAANILIPQEYQDQYPNQVFFSPEQLTALEKKGVDISKFDPAESEIWQAPKGDISQYDLTNYNGDSKKSLKNFFDDKFVDQFMDPEKMVDIEYLPDEQGGATPKILGKIKGKKFKVKISPDFSGKPPNNIGETLNALIIDTSREVYTEKVVNNLAHAIGFAVEPTYFKKKARLFFSDKKDFEKSYGDLLNRVNLSYSIFNPSSVFSMVKIDKGSNQKYIELHNISLEMKQDKKVDLNLSSFIREGMGRHLRREYRAASFFEALVQDVDVKDKNGKVKLIPYSDSGEARFRPVEVITDMGGSFGYGAPNQYLTNFVTRVFRDRHGQPRQINYEYPRFSRNVSDLLKTVSIADAQWLMKRVGQISYQQIYKSFHSSGYPDLVAMIMAQKFIGRRNQIMEALNLFEVRLGNGFILRKDPNEFNGSIPGFEQFFSHGKLTDQKGSLKFTENEEGPFPRVWTSSLDPRINDSLVKKNYKTLGLYGLNTLMGGISTGLSNKFDIKPLLTNFAPIQDLDQSISSFCLQGNCFAQALGVGPMGLIPFRFIVPNPDKNSSKQFLMVNMWRIGIRLDSKITTAKPFDALIPVNILNPSLTGGVNLIKEFITIKGSDQMEEYTRDFKSTFKTITFLSKNKLKNFVKEMERGQTLIMSTYLSTNLSPWVGSTASPIPISMGVGGNASLSLTNRLILNRQDDNQLLVNWARLSQKELAAVLRFNSLLGIDLVKLGVAQNKILDRTFRFNTSDEDDMNFLMQNLHTNLPIIVQDKNRLHTREFTSSNLRAQTGFLFWNAALDRQKGELTLKDFITGDHKREDFRSLKITKSKIIGYNTVNYQTIYKASINAQANIFISVYNHFLSKNLTRDKLHEVLDKMQAFLPPGFFPYNYTSLPYYLGSMILETRTIVSHDGLQKFFSYEESEICAKYAEFNSFDRAGCKKKIKPIRLKIFLLDFRQAKREFLKIVESKGDISIAKKHSMLKQLLDVIYRFSENRSFLQVVQSMIEENNFKTDAALFSEKGSIQEPFPGDTIYLGIDPKYSGGFIPSTRHLVLDPRLEFEIFSDNLYTGVVGSEAIK